MAIKTTTGLLNGETLDLKDVIELVSPTDTPLLTMLMAKGVTKATSINPTWREESLNATGDNAQLEGGDAVDATNGTRTVTGNNCQILKKTAGISGSLEASDVKGVASELNRSIEMRSKEIKMDCETYILAGTKADEVAGVSGRQMNGLLNMVDNVVDVSDVGGTGVGTLTEADFESALQMMWDKGVAGENTITFVPATIKKLLKTIYKTGKTSNYEDGGSMVMGIKVDTIVTDFGTCNLVMNRHMPAETILGVNLDYCELTELRAPFASDIPNGADKKEVQIIWEPSVKLTNKYAGFKIIGAKIAG